MKRIKCKHCNGFTVNGKHFAPGVIYDKDMKTIKGSSDWSDEDIKMTLEYDKKRKAGKMSYSEYGDDIDLMIKDRKEPQWVTYDKYGNPTYHYRREPTVP